jgi:DNA invertase Pin-like site-specific DNA recombinase
MKINQILRERRRKDALKNKNNSMKNKDNHRNYPLKIGYARVSTDVQRMDLQMDALKQAGCDQIFADQGISGASTERPGLQQAMDMLQKGDTLVVWRLDRLGRSLVNLVEYVSNLGKQDVEFRSLTESIDTSSSGGKLLFHMIAALAEFERSLISERTKAGMAAAKLRGKHVGRPPRIKPTQASKTTPKRHG